MADGFFGLMKPYAARRSSATSSGMRQNQAGKDTARHTAESISGSLSRAAAAVPIIVHLSLATATHRFLSIVPLQPLRMAERGAYLPLLREELRRSEAEGLLSREEAQAIRLEQVNGWFAGDLGQRFLRAEEARREWPFNLKLSGGTLLQGVIDCAFREADGWVLCDYKTDFIEDEQAFRQRHAGQLRWYQRAVEALTGIPVKEMWLWSLRLNKGFSVEKE